MGVGRGVVAEQRVNVRVGIGMPLAASATANAVAAWQLTAACFRGDGDEWTVDEEENESRDPWFEDGNAETEECRTEADEGNWQDGGAKGREK